MQRDFISGTVRREQADVVVVGGGGSGLAAAIAAAGAGAHVIVLEKNSHFGGTTCLSIGSITAAGTRFQRKKGIVDTPDEHFEDMSLFLRPEILQRENLELRRVLVDNVPETLEWLVGLGLSFYGPVSEPPHRKPRMHNVLPNSRAYPYYLVRECRRLGIDMRTGVRAEHLMLDGQDVVGIVAREGSGLVEYTARGGVILASGDYSASVELKTLNMPHAAHVDAINPSSTGDGHLMASANGGWIRNPDLMYGPSMRFKEPPRDTLLKRLPPHPLITAPMQFALNNLPLKLFRPFITKFMTASLAPEPSLLRAGAILVNHDGRRFADELNKPEVQVANQPGKEAFIVFDRKLGELFQAWPNFVSTAPGIAYAYLDDYRGTRKDLYHRASTIEGLAKDIGVPFASLRRSIDEHNSTLATAGGSDDTRTPILEGPFYALGPVQSWIVLTDGGLAVNAHHQVLKTDGSAIRGLYAAGSTGQGGVILAGHGHHIGWAMTSGRRAGRFAAERAGSGLQSASLAL